MTIDLSVEAQERVRTAAEINRRAGAWVTSPGLAPPVTVLDPPDLPGVDDLVREAEWRSHLHPRDRLGKWIDTPDLPNVAALPSTPDLASVPDAPSVPPSAEAALLSLPAGDAAYEHLIGAPPVPGVRWRRNQPGVMRDHDTLIVGNEFLAASQEERQRMVANPLPPPPGRPLDMENLDRLIEDVLQPEKLDADRVAHPKSGYMVKSGLERRITPPPEGERETPLMFTVTRHGESMFPEKVGTEPVKFVYRGVSEEEWAQARERGFIQSDRRGVISEWEGTNAGVEPQTAVSYLPSNGVGRIVKIRVEPEDKWFAISHDGYARTREPVPLDRVVAHTPPILKDPDWHLRLLDAVPEPAVAEEPKALYAPMPSVAQSVTVPKSGKARGYILEAIESIDAVLKDVPWMPDIPVKATAGRNSRGAYARQGEDMKPHQIRLSSSDEAEGPVATFVHEWAHFLDNTVLSPDTRAFGTFIAAYHAEREATNEEMQDDLKGMKPEYKNALHKLVDEATPDPALMDLWKAMRETPEYEKLGKGSINDFATLKYLRRPTEMFARAFTQWIALRSGDEGLRQDVDEWVDEERVVDRVRRARQREVDRTNAKRAERGWGPVPDAPAPSLDSLRSSMRWRQWDWENFKPVAEALDRLFAERGMLRT